MYVYLHALDYIVSPTAPLLHRTRNICGSSTVASHRFRRTKIPVDGFRAVRNSSGQTPALEHVNMKFINMHNELQCIRGVHFTYINRK